MLLHWQANGGQLHVSCINLTVSSAVKFQSNRWLSNRWMSNRSFKGKHTFCWDKLKRCIAFGLNKSLTPAMCTTCKLYVGSLCKGTISSSDCQACQLLIQLLTRCLTRNKAAQPDSNRTSNVVLGPGCGTFNVEGLHAVCECKMMCQATKLSLTGLCCAAGRNWTRFLNLAHSGSVSFQEQLEQSGSPMHQNPGKHSFIVPYNAVQSGMDQP